MSTGALCGTDDILVPGVDTALGAGLEGDSLAACNIKYCLAAHKKLARILRNNNKSAV